MRSQSENMTEKKIICRSCGAEYDVSLVRCPFCKTAYAPAEEDEYMDKLEEVREDLHREVVKGDTRIKKKMSSTVCAILLVVIVILLIFFGILRLLAGLERGRSDRKKMEFLQDQGITTQQEDTDR